MAAWAALVTAKETRVSSMLPLLAAGLAPAPGLAGLLGVPCWQDTTARLKVIPTKNRDRNLLSEVNDRFLPAGGSCDR